MIFYSFILTLSVDFGSCYQMSIYPHRGSSGGGTRTETTWRICAGNREATVHLYILFADTLSLIHSIIIVEYIYFMTVLTKGSKASYAGYWADYIDV